MNVTGTVVFDSMGRVWKEGQPVFEPATTKPTGLARNWSVHHQPATM